MRLLQLPGADPAEMAMLAADAQALEVAGKPGVVVTTSRIVLVL
jgi:hypothetical protein